MILEFLHPDVILGCCETPCSLGLMQQQQQQKQTIAALISARLLAGFRVLHRFRVSSFRRLGNRRTSSWVVLSCWVVEFSQDMNFHSMENSVGIADLAKDDEEDITEKQTDLDSYCEAQKISICVFMSMLQHTGLQLGLLLLLK